MTENLKIEHVTTAEKAAEYMEKGYCIVDCSPEGVRCFLTNGPEGDCGFTLNSPRVAQLAYGPYFAARQKNPCFVTTGPPRVDAIFGILALAGELPHPKRADQFKDAVHELSERFTRDLTRLAQFADQMELDPLRISSEHKEGKLKSGSGKKVTNRKQAVAIALNEARRSGAKVPKKKSAK